MRNFFIASLALLVLAACAATSSDSADPADPPRPDVELGDSFMIPDAQISHTPGVIFTQDRKKMMTATAGGDLVVFEASSRKLLQRIKISEETTNAVSIEGSGKYVAWGLAKGGLIVVEVSTGKIIAREGSGTVSSIAVSPDARQVAVATGKQLELRAFPTLKLVRSLPAQAAEITNLAWSADGRRLGSTADDGTLRIDDPSDGKAFHEVKKSGPLYTLAFHPAGTRVAYGGKDKQVYQYDFETKKEEVISQNQPYYITCLGYSPDGERIAVGDESCDIWLYHLETRKMTFHNKHHNECWLNSVAWASDNETFLFGCRPNSLQGKPTLYEPLLYAEASQSKPVAKNRLELMKAVDAQLARTTDAEQRSSLDRYKKSLSSAGQPGMADFPGTTELSFPSTSGGGVLTGAAFTLTEERASATPSVDSLPPALQKLAGEHQQLLQNEVNRLKANYCVNQWKVKK